MATSYALKSSESLEQQALIEWCNIPSIYNKYKGVDLIFSIPNGGSRNKIEAAKLKREGVKKGVPDLYLPIAKGNYHGLFIEMKYGKNKPSKEQIEMMNRLSEQGYKTILCYSFNEACDEIKKYYNLD